AYSALALTGWGMYRTRRTQSVQPLWWRIVHVLFGISLLALVIELLAVGVIGTLGHYGHLGHSIHWVAGITVVAIALGSALVALQIRRGKPWARMLHVRLNLLLGIALLWVLGSGWVVVQKYLP
ncbi:MAG: DUF4079 domain-containing protein, partial [Thermosynechococcaceae cyanobacterium]